MKAARQELEELDKAVTVGNDRAVEEEFGDYLFALVNYARFIGIEPETALRATVEKFTKRFQYIEHEMKRNGKDIHNSTLGEMDDLWNEAKKEE